MQLKLRTSLSRVHTHTHVHARVCVYLSLFKIKSYGDFLKHAHAVYCQTHSSNVAEDIVDHRLQSMYL